MLSRNAISLAATSLHPQDARQRLAVDRDRDEIVAGRDLVRSATEPPKAATSTNWSTTEGLSNEAEGPKTTTTSTTSRLARLAQQVAERRQERGIGRRVTGLAAPPTLAAGGRQRGGR